MKYFAVLMVSLLFFGCGGDDTPKEETTQEVIYEDAPLNLSGEIVKNMRFYAANDYTIEENVAVKDGAKLSIEEGTKFSTVEDVYLLIAKDASIDAQGTTQNPIVFDGVNVVILGSAQTNKGEISYENFKFGQDDDYYNRQSSGKIKHVKIVDGGLTLGGVGASTTVEYISVENSSNDGIKVIGGTVNLRNIKILNAKEDSLDLSSGYIGIVEELNITQKQTAQAGVEISSGLQAPYTTPIINRFNIKTATGSLEGGIYLKDNYILGIFANGTIEHFGNGGIINSNTTQFEDVGFKDVVLSGDNTELSGSTAKELKQRYEANDADPDVCECEK